MSRKKGAQAYRWDDLPNDEPMALLERRRIYGERALLSHVRLKKGCLVPLHHHENEQFACILSGRVRFGIGDDAGNLVETMILEAGQVLHLPSNVPHSAEALEDTLVLDIFCPPSEKTGIDRADA